VGCLSPLLLGGESPPLSTSLPAPTRARVLVVSDPGATDSYKPRPDVIHRLVNRGITRFAGKQDPAAAWLSFVHSNDVIGIKVFSQPGSQVGTRVAVVEGIIEGLLAAKVPASNIVVWDHRLIDLHHAGFGEMPSRYGVRLAGSVDAGFDEKVFYESSLLCQLVFGDLEFQKQGESVARKSFVTKLVTRQITKIINVSPLLNHNSVGVCGNLYSLALGSIDNSIRFENDPGKLSTVVPEIYALPPLGDHVALNIVDALICQYQGEQIGHLHYSAALNELRFSSDPVALDVLSLEELDRQRARVSAPGISRTNQMDLYRNAEILELGIADPRRIDVELVPP